jgi:tRNA 2-selenouridine synthase
MLISIDEFLNLRKELPITDVRSEGEYEAGHIPKAVNIPLLNNEERKAVGIDYKTKGQHEAIKTGFRMVGPRLIDIIQQAGQVATHQELLVHCWRGGMRSENFCRFAEMAGIKTHALKGGYKTYRQKAHESFRQPFHLVLLTGLTGSGKSEMLRELKKAGEQVLDLEQLAVHKGSAFGGLMMPAQPTTEQFENNLFEEILKLDPAKRIWVEDESIAIGKIFLPPDFWQTMNQSPIVLMNVEKPVRIHRLVNEYGQAEREEFLMAMGKITKRLGGQLYKEACEKWKAGDSASTIDILLTYYDKAYLQSMERKRERILIKAQWNGDSAGKFARQLIDRLNEWNTKQATRWIQSN